MCGHAAARIAGGGRDASGGRTHAAALLEGDGRPTLRCPAARVRWGNVARAAALAHARRAHHRLAPPGPPAPELPPAARSRLCPSHPRPPVAPRARGPTRRRPARRAPRRAAPAAPRQRPAAPRVRAPQRPRPARASPPAHAADARVPKPEAEPQHTPRPATRPSRVPTPMTARNPTSHDAPESPAHPAEHGAGRGGRVPFSRGALAALHSPRPTQGHTIPGRGATSRRPAPGPSQPTSQATLATISAS